MLYKMIYRLGDGKDTDGGIWEKKETEKTISFIQVKESFFNPNYTRFRINKFYKNDGSRQDGNYNAVRRIQEGIVEYTGYFNNGHCLRGWDDGTYTCYVEQSGIPYYFEPIETTINTTT